MNNPSKPRQTVKITVLVTIAITVALPEAYRIPLGRWLTAALCANIDETTASSFITVEGQEANKDGRSWNGTTTLAAVWRL